MPSDLTRVGDNFETDFERGFATQTLSQSLKVGGLTQTDGTYSYQHSC